MKYLTVIGALSANSSILMVPLEVSMTTTEFLSAFPAPQPASTPLRAARNNTRFMMVSLHQVERYSGINSRPHRPDNCKCGFHRQPRIKHGRNTDRKFLLLFRVDPCFISGFGN